MAVYRVVGALLCVLAVSNIMFSTCHVLRGSVVCIGCDGRDDLKGIKILVKCDKVKRMGMATTRVDGTFETELPSDIQAPSSSPSQKNCQALILGGPKQLYASTRTAFSTIIPMADNSYTVSQPLNFYASCPPAAKCEAVGSSLGSSKTIDLPLPKEWGLPPSSYYVPFMPIIGIP